MVWEPFVLALVFGLLVSAALYFMLLWPGREPPGSTDPDPPRAGVDDRAGSQREIA